MPGTAPAPLRESERRTCARAIDAFLRRGRLRQVTIAEGTRPPPALGYLVHFPRLSVTLKGTDPMLIEQAGAIRLVRAERGEAVLVPANCWNRPNWTEASVVLNFLFGRHQVGLSLVAHDGDGGEPREAVKLSLRGDAETPLRRMLEALLAIGRRSPQSAPLLVDALLRATRDLLLEPAAPLPGRAAGLYESVCMFVQEHFHLPLSRSSVAAHFRVTPNHVSRLFHRHGAVGFNDYVTYVRVDRAKFLLKSYGQTVSEVGAACGFSDAPYFCRVFKQITKITPTAYRRAARPL